MSGRYTISQLARAAGIPATTLRYYERIRLLEPEDRSAGNYRLYSDESLRTLNFIRAAQAIGFTLNDVRALLGAGSDTPSCSEVQELIEDRLADVGCRLKDLRHVQRVLKAALTKCQKSKPSAPCQVLVTLKGRA